MPVREVPDVVLMLYPTDCPHGLQVYGLGFDGRRITFKKIISFDRAAHHGSGFAVSGTKLYAVGNVWSLSQPWNEFKTWDLTNWSKKGVSNGFPEQCGKTLGDKPLPVVFEVDGRIYALAAMGISANQGPVFEVFDPSVGTWKDLSNPPFIGDYAMKHCPQIQSHTLIGKTLYVALLYFRGRIPDGPWKYFSYDVLSDAWETITETTVIVDPKAQNFLKHCGMRKIDYVDDNMMAFTCSPNMKVYACDLNTDLEELAELHPLLPQCKKAKIDRDYASTVSDASMSMGSEECDPHKLGLSDAFLPVIGFEKIAKQLPTHRSNNQMVAHLTGNIYCVVYFYVPYKERRQLVYVVVFEALKWTKEEGCRRAEILAKSRFEVDSIMSLHAWCKFKFNV